MVRVECEVMAVRPPFEMGDDHRRLSPCTVNLLALGLLKGHTSACYCSIGCALSLHFPPEQVVLPCSAALMGF